MFVVVGATGHTGSTVAETLLRHGRPVRVVVRSADKGVAWKAKRADVAVATYQDVKAMAKAFEGARGVYLLVPPSYQVPAWLDEQRRTMDLAAEALAASDKPHVVFLSSIGAHIAEGTGPIRAVRYGEQRLSAVVQNMTILRPCYFMDNWVPGIGLAKAHGVLPTFIEPSAKIPMISTQDIGRVAAEQLLAGGAGKKVLELAGPEDYSPDQVAELLGELLGKTVTARLEPFSAVVPTFTSFGFSNEAARLFEEMYTSFAKGAIGYERPREVVRGSVTLREALRNMM
ncbi:MAG: NAD(P)H-binding protein [Nitrospira sp.]|nr:NAD(P)H-binding protein [Nitrospira sp.]